MAARDAAMHRVGRKQGAEHAEINTDIFAQLEYDVWKFVGLRAVHHVFSGKSPATHGLSTVVTNAEEKRANALGEVATRRTDYRRRDVDTAGKVPAKGA